MKCPAPMNRGYYTCLVQSYCPFLFVEYGRLITDARLSQYYLYTLNKLSNFARRGYVDLLYFESTMTGYSIQQLATWWKYVQPLFKNVAIDRWDWYTLDDKAKAQAERYLRAFGLLTGSQFCHYAFEEAWKEFVQVPEDDIEYIQHFDNE